MTPKIKICQSRVIIKKSNGNVLGVKILVKIGFAQKAVGRESRQANQGEKN
jgi:hypothetical protein